MKKLSPVIFSVCALFLLGCEMPDIKGMNEMPKTTADMNDKMDTTNQKMDATNQKMDKTTDGVHKQTLLLAVIEMNKPENQENISPVPTGLMPAGKIFAEEAYPDELIEYTYNELVKLNENEFITGFDSDGMGVSLTEPEMAVARRKRKATFWSLAIIAGFTQDEKIEQIIQHDIKGNGRFQDTALSFLALRAFFLREVLLNLSLKVNQTMEDPAKAPTLDNSGKMKEALKYLVKLDKISKLKFSKPIQFQVASPGGLLNESFVLDDEARDVTAQYWAGALDNSLKGSQSFVPSSDDGGINQAEIDAQQQAIASMRTYAESWKAFRETFQKRKTEKELEEKKKKEEQDKAAAPQTDAPVDQK